VGLELLRGLERLLGQHRDLVGALGCFLADDPADATGILVDASLRVDHLDDDRGGHLRVHVDRDLVGPDLLDGAAQLDPLARDVVATLLEHPRDVVRADRSVEVATVVDARGDPQRAGLEDLAGRLGIAEGLGLVDLAGAGECLRLPHGAGRGEDRHAPRHEVVAAVAVRHVDDVTGETEVVDLALQDQLHRGLLSGSCRGSAPSRGRS
jgi:hypothetical protein